MSDQPSTLPTELFYAIIAYYIAQAVDEQLAIPLSSQDRDRVCSAPLKDLRRDTDICSIDVGVSSLLATSHQIRAITLDYLKTSIALPVSTDHFPTLTTPLDIHLLSCLQWTLSPPPDAGDEPSALAETIKDSPIFTAYKAFQSALKVLNQVMKLFLAVKQGYKTFIDTQSYAKSPDLVARFLGQISQMHSKIRSERCQGVYLILVKRTRDLRLEYPVFAERLEKRVSEVRFETDLVYALGPVVSRLRFATACAHYAAGRPRAGVWRDAAIKTNLEQNLIPNLHKDLQQIERSLGFPTLEPIAGEPRTRTEGLLERENLWDLEDALMRFSRLHTQQPALELGECSLLARNLGQQLRAFMERQENPSSLFSGLDLSSIADMLSGMEAGSEWPVVTTPHNYRKRRGRWT